ncbi:hypothetical protein AVEN_223560-1 [Araneus ventricosus]|uniref:Uncharacterized protein n=1 Tax=Araneus ventricosus TaxID=182803 RepID=A0A4Y2IZV6_ARAVE|nr:hypothetical protein AVEN_223560-1 [Araneus ventricosus]
MRVESSSVLFTGISLIKASVDPRKYNQAKIEHQLLGLVYQTTIPDPLFLKFCVCLLMNVMAIGLGQDFMAQRLLNQLFIQKFRHKFFHKYLLVSSTQINRATIPNN